MIHKRTGSYTRERISRILELRKMFLPFQTGFNLVNAAIVCVILQSISGLEPLSDTTEPRYLKLVTPRFCPFDFLVDAAGVVINLVFSAVISTL